MKKSKIITSSRDKSLLVFLVTLILIFLLYRYGIEPAWSQGTQLVLEAEQVESRLTTAQEAVTSLPQNRETDARTYEELNEKYKPFFYEINQERILHRLDTLIATAGMNVTSYNQTEMALETVPVYGSLEDSVTYPILRDAATMNDTLLPNTETQNSEGGGSGTSNSSAGTSASESAEDAIPATHISLGFSGAGYGNILSFLRQIEAAERAVILEGINLSKDEEGTTLNGTISLGLYAMPKLNPDESADLMFRPVLPSGKANPFQ